MNNTRLILAHFSPTGGTKKVADAIARGVSMPVCEVDLTGDVSAMDLTPGENLMAVVPVYAGRVPGIALERLSKIRGNGQKAVAVVVYGNREYDDALLETKNALEANGFSVAAAGAFIAEHSIVRSVAAGRPDAEDVEIATEFGRKVMQKLDALGSVEVPGNRPYAQHPPTPFHPSANESCVKCGLCAGKCPTGAISPEEPRTCDGDLCINCLRCVQVCPLQCRSMPEQFMAWITDMLSKNAAGYKKPVIFLSEKE